MKKIVCLLLWFAALPTSGQAAAPDAEEVTAAAARGDRAALVDLLNKGGSVEARNARGWPPLICALGAQKIETARVLLARHADPNVQTEKGCAALNAAVISQCDEAVPLLLDAGADINGFFSKDDEGRTYSPLMNAVDGHRPAMIKLLLARGALLEARNNVGRTALMMGSMKPYPDQVALLVEHGADVNARTTDGHTALIYAAYNGVEESVRLLLAKGADIHAIATDGPGEPPYGALEVATHQGHPYTLEALVDAGATPAVPVNGLNEELNEAITLHDYERAQAALAKGASASQPDANHVYPLTVAVLLGDLPTVQMLIKAGADVNTRVDGDARTLPLADALYQSRHAKTPGEKEKFDRVAEGLRKAGAKE